MLKILLVATLNSGNRYVDDLYKALKNLDIYINISITDFWDSTEYYDIIHIQWIESLFCWDLEEFSTQELNRLRNRLEVLLSRGSKIIYTRHNSIPHFHKNKNIQELFRAVSNYSSGIVHLGAYSLSEFKEQYTDLENNIKHTVITHGNYCSLKNNISRNAARRSLNIDLDRFVILCFGAFRTFEEKKLVLNAFKSVNINKKTLPLNRWQVNNKTTFIYRLIDTFKRKLLCLSKQYRLYNLYTADDNIQNYLNASDVLVVSRIDQLNSGNLYLGLTFGKVIVAPAIGNITEVIKSTGNILFNPVVKGSLNKALEEAATLVDSDLAYNNLKFSTEHCNWEKIAKEHFNFYKNV